MHSLCATPPAFRRPLQHEGLNMWKLAALLATLISLPAIDAAGEAHTRHTGHIPDYPAALGSVFLRAVFP